MKPSLTSCRVASSVACGSGSSVSSSPTTSTLMKSENPAARARRARRTAPHDQGIVRSAAAYEVDELQLIPRVDLGLVEIVAAPDLAVVLDDDPGRLDVELLEQIEEADAIGYRARLAVERDRDLAHRRDTVSRVTRAS